MESSKTKTEAATEEKRIFKENDFRIEQMKEEYFDELLTLYTEFFAPREPLGCGLHLKKEEIAKFLSQSAKDWIKCRTSVCAIFVPENKIVGAIFTKILNRNDQETFNEEDISQFTPGVQTLIKVLCKIESSYNVFEQDSDVNKVLEVAATTVDPSFSGNKLVYRMTEECERIARELGCQVATTQSTNKITQHIRKKMGFESRLRIEYQDIEVDGVKPLDISAMNGTTGANIFVKYL
ncbi:hypothetical protein Avbf_11165 [Armadillidium vulgare]|nr:hypothetical protein Avbf_11165 [Armadillidium vulgare]